MGLEKYKSIHFKRTMHGFVYSVFKKYNDIQLLCIQHDKIICYFVSYSCWKLCTLYLECIYC